MSVHASCSLTSIFCSLSPLLVADARRAHRRRFTPLYTRLLASFNLSCEARSSGEMAHVDKTTGAAAGAHVTPLGAPTASKPRLPAIRPTCPTTTAVAAATDGGAANDIEQSPLDDRRFRRVTLPNGLRVLLVEDAASETAAACLSVAVGHCSDPTELPGLAHFCEHMVFLGSEKYPTEGAFFAFVKAHGGFANASTEDELTTFYLSVMVGKGGRKSGEDDTKRVPAAAQGATAGEGPGLATPAADSPTLEPPALDIPGSIPRGLAPYYEALDRFAQFFISPLFTPSATAREVQAVNSEFKNALLNDTFRFNQLLKSAAAPGHPFRTFSLGNAASLWDRPTAEGIDVRAALLAFHGRHYSANQMALVLVAPAPLDDLAAWVGALFGAVPNTNAPLAADAYAGLVPYGPAETARLFRIVPVSESRAVRIFWAIPPSKATYRTNPAGFLADRINYAGPGSLVSALKARGWATYLRAWEWFRTTHLTMLQVSVFQTVAGTAETDAVVGAVFAYIRLVRQQGVTRRAYADVAARARLEWTYKEREEPIATAVVTARAMHTFPDAHLLTGKHLYEVYDEELIQSTAAALTPAAVLILSFDPAFAGETDKVDEWFGTEYSEEAIPDVTLAGWTDAEAWPELSVAPPNDFIPTDFSLVCDAIQSASDDMGALKVAMRQPTVDEMKDETPTGPADTSLSGAGGSSVVPCGHGVGPDVVAKVVDDATPKSEGHASPPCRPFPLLSIPVLPADAIGSANPVVLRHDASVRLHYKLDHTFRRPHGRVYIKFVTPGLFATPRSFVLASLACRLLTDDLTEQTKNAEDAGLRYRIRVSGDCFCLRLDGFSDKLPLLLQCVVDRLVGLRADPDRFSRVLEDLHHFYEVRVKDEPHSHACSVSEMLLYPHQWHATEILRCFGDEPDEAPSTGGPVGRRARMHPLPLAPVELDAFLASVWQRGVFIEALVTGNVAPAAALAMIAAVEDALPALPLPTADHPVFRVVELPTRHPVIARIASPHPQNTNSAVRVVFQVGCVGDPSADVALDLLRRMLSDYAFNELRTQQQLGYRVSVSSRERMGVSTLHVVIQSPSAAPETLTERILTCLEEFGADTLPTMDPTSFKTAMTTSLRKPDQQLSTETSRFISEIDKHTYNWGRRAAQADALEGVNTATLVRLWATHFAADAPQRRMLVAAVHPPQHPPALSAAEERAAGGGGGGDARAPIVLDDVVANPAAVRAFHNSRPLFPAQGFFEAGATGFSV